MRRYPRLLIGLVFVASPVYSQEYIDVEAERRQQEGRQQVGLPQEQSSQADLPRGGQATTAYDTSVVPDSAPVGDPTQNFGEILYQLQLLQREVMTLRGQMEEQGHQLRQLKEQSLERYVDLDRRLSEGSGGGSNSTGSTEAPTGAGGSSAGVELPGEADAYRAAYSEVRSQQFADAVLAFKQFLKDYPDGRYAPNAHYWLGELYLVVTPQDLESARQSFTLLLEQYPDNSKIPDTLYKLGRVYFQKGNPEKSRLFLDRLIREYGNSNSSAVKLARDFINENF
jgi:tol-pal system protein YbgF